MSADLFGCAAPQHAPTPKELRREREALKRALARCRAELDSWAGDVLHRDVGFAVCERLGAPGFRPGGDPLPVDLILIDGSGPASRWRAKVLKELGAAEPIRNAELLRLAVRAGLASPETAAEFKRRVAECRALHRRVQAARP